MPGHRLAEDKAEKTKETDNPAREVRRRSVEDIYHRVGDVDTSLHAFGYKN